MDHVSSADLPAEFRGADTDLESDDGQQGKQEQSKLAKLCQQTSNVLASVLPAPFGGHKRSVLCQFFGQVPFSFQAPGKKTNNGAATKQQQLVSDPIASNYPSPAEQSIAILHQHQQKPIAFLNSARHPIEIVLEQQQQQRAQQQQMHLPMGPNWVGGQFALQNQPLQLAQPLQADLKSSASVIDYAYHQKLEPPTQMLQQQPRQTLRQQQMTMKAKSSALDEIKFSKPITANSFKPIVTMAYNLNSQSTTPKSSSSPLAAALGNSSIGGWRIFNHELESLSVSTPAMKSSSTTTMPSVDRRNKTETILESSRTNNITISSGETKEQQRSAKTNFAAALIILGKPPGFSSSNNYNNSSKSNQQHSSTTEQSTNKVSIGKRTEALKSTTQKMANQQTTLADVNELQATPTAKPVAASEVRTIEVIAQSSALNNSSSQERTTTTSRKSPHQAVAANQTTTSKPSPSELKQVQKREELVIASINNLTRIAFGNQLRDTVKVINKLIDQQAILFSSDPKAANNKLTDSKSIDSMLTSESKLKQSTASSKTIKELNGINKQSRQKEITTGASTLSTTTPIKPTKNKQPKKQQQLFNRTTTASQIMVSNSKSDLFSIKDAKTTSKPTSEGRKLWTINQPLRGESRRISSISPTAAFSAGSHAISRSLSSMFDHDMRKTTPPMGSYYDYDYMKTAATTIDLQRDARSDKREMDRLAGSTKLPARLFATKSQHQPKTELIEQASGRYPWLLPSKNLDSDLLASSTTPWERKESLYGTKSTTRKVPTPYQLPLSSLSTKQALVLNRLDSKSQEKTKMDSLTTLKLSLASHLQQQKLSTLASTTQSRWIPTTIAKSTTTTTTTTTTPKPMTTLLDDNQQASEASGSVTVELMASSESNQQQVTAGKGSTASNMNNIDAKATDSISKYTASQFNANDEANESLLTTTRRIFSQSMPQIAQTGEYFNAETISSWPERYQTMIDGSATAVMDGRSNSKQTTPSIHETTRRNGEAFETTRHRVETTPARTTKVDLPTTRSFLNNLSMLHGITILPSNHKLISAASKQQETNEQSDDDDGYETVTVPETKTTLSFVLPKTETTTTKPALKRSVDQGMTYTLVGPQSSPTRAGLGNGGGEISDGSTSNAEKFPYISSDTFNYSNTSIRAGNSMRPPYLDYALQQALPINDDLEEYDARQQRLFNSNRKLYELLMPNQSRQFLNIQNPLQKFNLSTLKFLAQSLISGNNSYSNYTSDLNQMDPASESIDNQANSSSQYSHNQQRRLLDLLNVSLPMSYYDLLDLEDSQANKSTPVQVASNKNILSRASNLLTDLKQLEQKKAAALLAAIRYQVPGPLIRPWDMFSDSSPAELSFINERFDDLASRESQQQSGFLLHQIANAIKSTLNKQRVVPRAELEARLNKKRAKSSESIMNRRSDDTLSYSLDAGSSTNDDDESISQESSSKKNSTMAGGWLDKLLHMNDGNKTIGHLKDFDLINVSNVTEPVARNHLHPVAQRSHNSGPAKLNKVVIEDASELQGSKQRDGRGKSFECSDKQAGFYPDAESVCQTFYHCSNTGHLLTFDCPKQTRFDEKSLKCGPWFEVPCDFGRIKS